MLPRSPLPQVTDAMRAAAFPPGLDGHPAHGKALRALLLVEKLEWRDGADGGAPVWDVSAWWGGPLNRVWLRTEGSHSAGDETEAHLELFWGHAISRWWDVLLGIRQEFSGSSPRTSMAFGVQGLAPQWFETQLTALVSDEGHHGLALQMDRDLLLTNRLILQPRLDLEARARDEPRTGLGSGLSVGRFSLRLRYEAHREFAPYLGIEWEWAFGDSADFRRAQRRAVEETRLVLGLRMWF